MIPRLYPDFDLSLHDLRRALPALAFFAGFLWDALTLGRAVSALDLVILTAYLAGAAGVLWWLGRRQALAASVASDPPPDPVWLRRRAPGGGNPAPTCCCNSCSAACSRPCSSST